MRIRSSTIRKGEDGGETVGERFDQLLLRIMLPLRIERFFNRRAEAFGQARAENLAVRDLCEIQWPRAGHVPAV